MFGRKKPKVRTSAHLYSENLQLLAMAREAGDMKNEMILSLVAVADDAMQMLEAHSRIVGLFDERLEELLEDACLYFPIELSTKLGELREYFDRIDDEVGEASSHSHALLIQMAAQTNK